MDATEIGHAGLQGWRATLADKTASQVSDHTPLDEDQWRALVGGAFVVLSFVYLVNFARALAQDS